MSLSEWLFGAIHQKLDALAATQAQIIRAQQNQVAMNAAVFSKLGVIMTTLSELKDLATVAFAENSESLGKALTLIEELKGKIPNPSDWQIVEDVASLLRNTIAANDDFQAKLNPPASEQ